MNAKFREPERKGETVEEIFVAGEKVGWVKTGENDHPAYRYHVGFNLNSYISLIQGHGGTKEAAILDAIENGRRNAQELLVEVDKLAERLAV